MRQSVTRIWHTGAVIVLILLPSGAQQARNHGETCFFDDECVDHHMSCEANVNDSSVKHCYCNRYHIWDEELKQCLQIENTTNVLTPHHEEQDNTKLHSLSEHKMFIKISIVGLIAVISICTFLVSCTAYGCCSCTRATCRNKDQKTNQPAASCPPTCPLHNVPLLQQDKPLVEQAKKTQWQAMPYSMTPALDIDI